MKSTRQRFSVIRRLVLHGLGSLNLGHRSFDHVRELAIAILAFGSLQKLNVVRSEGKVWRRDIKKLCREEAYCSSYWEYQQVTLAKELIKASNV